MTTSNPPDFLRPHERVELRTSVLWSLYGVWYRHVKVYCRTLIANAFPPVLEPLFFFTAFAIGLAGYMRSGDFAGLDYKTFVASGMVAATAMFTGVFETTFSTFVRITWQKTYDAMLSTHLLLREVFIGELLFCASKGALFATIVLLVTMLFGIQITPWVVLVPVLGGICGYTFGAIGLVVTSYVKMINNFAFFTTGVITPLFFFSGTFFPIQGINPVVDVVWFLLPLTHFVELARALYQPATDPLLLAHAAMIALWLVGAHVFALRRMRLRILG
jgi:lipooligosaccharide transport system permease protein